MVNIILLLISGVSVALVVMQTARVLEAPSWLLFPIGMSAGAAFGYALASRLFPTRADYRWQRIVPYLVGAFVLMVILERILPR